MEYLPGGKMASSICRATSVTSKVARPEPAPQTFPYGTMLPKIWEVGASGRPYSTQTLFPSANRNSACSLAKEDPCAHSNGNHAMRNRLRMVLNISRATPLIQNKRRPGLLIEIEAIEHIVSFAVARGQRRKAE